MAKKNITALERAAELAKQKAREEMEAFEREFRERMARLKAAEAEEVSKRAEALKAAKAARAEEIGDVARKFSLDKDLIRVSNEAVIGALSLLVGADDKELAALEEKAASFRRGRKKLSPSAGADGETAKETADGHAGEADVGAEAAGEVDEAVTNVVETNLVEASDTDEIATFVDEATETESEVSAEASDVVIADTVEETVTAPSDQAQSGGLLNTVRRWGSNGY